MVVATTNDFDDYIEYYHRYGGWPTNTPQSIIERWNNLNHTGGKHLATANLSELTVDDSSLPKTRNLVGMGDTGLQDDDEM